MSGSLWSPRLGVWVARIDAGRDHITGKRRRISRTTRGSKRDAQKVLNEMAVEVDRGRSTGGVYRGFRPRPFRQRPPKVRWTGPGDGAPGARNHSTSLPPSCSVGLGQHESSGQRDTTTSGKAVTSRHRTLRKSLHFLRPPRRSSQSSVGSSTSLRRREHGRANSAR
jgi:hypothetical protein